MSVVCLLPVEAESPVMVPELEVELLRHHMQIGRRRLRARQYLYRGGQPFHGLYLVQAGFLKTSNLAEGGREQVTGFRMRGDLLGVESIGLAHHVGDAVALDDTEVWELPYPPVLDACRHVPALQAQLATAMAEEIRRSRGWMLTIGTLPAEPRVAAFLLDVSARLARLGLGDQRFVLRMTRMDIASFLALKHETVSRALSHLERLQLIEVSHREVALLDADGLRGFIDAASG